MAVIRSTYDSHDVAGTSSDEMVDELVAELRTKPSDDLPMKQPLILERELPTKTLSVAVIWERWRLIPNGDRSRVIMRAYELGEPDRVDKITVAMAATTDEAISLGLLPYVIEPTVRPGELDENTIRREMLAEGGVETPTGLKLRFPTKTAAEAAWHRLTAKTKQAHWSLIQTIRMDVDT